MSFKSLVAAAALSLMALPGLAETGIKVMDPYARTSTPSSKSGAIFFQLVNQGEADRLIGAKTTIAKEAQLHTHQEDANGVMRMLHIEEGFELPADATLAFERGGKHVMLMGLTTTLEQGATVPLTLIFEKAGELSVDVPVDLTRKAKANSGHDHGHDEDHSGHNTHGDH